MSERRYCRRGVFVLLAVLGLNTLTYAAIIHDFRIFNNSIYEQDERLNFTLTITDEGPTYSGKQKIGFKFNNNSTISSSITDIYFDARPDTGSSLDFGSYVSIIESSGVSFNEDAYPTTLPGGDELTPVFDTFPEYSVDSDYSYFSDKGINPDEWLKLIFTLKYDRTMDDVIAELAAGGSSENNLRVGIYIQSLPQSNSHPSGGCCCPPDYTDSASAINCIQQEPIPEPTTIVLLAMGSLVFTRKNNKKAIERKRL